MDYIDEETITEVGNIIKVTQDSERELEFQKDIPDVKEFIQKQIAELFAIQANDVKRNKELLALIREQLINQVQSGDLTFSQLMQLMNSLLAKDNEGANSIFSLLKPGQQGSVSGLLESPETNDNKIDDMYDSMSSKQIEKLDKIIDFFSKEVEE